MGVKGVHLHVGGEFPLVNYKHIDIINCLKTYQEDDYLLLLWEANGVLRLACSLSTFLPPLPVHPFTLPNYLSHVYQRHFQISYRTTNYIRGEVKPVSIYLSL
jgi:hypothetical protein